MNHEIDNCDRTPTDPSASASRGENPVYHMQEGSSAVSKMPAEKNQDGQPHRERLPDTRNSLTHKFRIGQHEGYMTIGFYADGRPGEVFITMAKEGSTIGGLLDTVGILTSIALQHGVPLDMLARKLEHVSFEPSGWTPDPTIRRATSIIDYIFRWLGLRFSESYRQETLAPHDR